MESNQLKPKNYLVLAIISTILCCLPAGIVSIIYAAKVNGLYAEGKYNEAVQASKNAKTWLIVTVSLGVIIYLFYFIFGLTFLGSVANDY